jgi:hypothetical protein
MNMLLGSRTRIVFQCLGLLKLYNRRLIQYYTYAINSLLI